MTPARPSHRAGGSFIHRATGNKRHELSGVDSTCSASRWRLAGQVRERSVVPRVLTGNGISAVMQPRSVQSVVSRVLSGLLIGESLLEHRCRRCRVEPIRPADPQRDGGFSAPGQGDPKPLSEAAP